ncbi:putative membrane protein [Pedobacter westerhofensis]|uniref:Putative membrane protein n=1 Tax=Pedobacter westerhofensis TaxID=425512 RepID=A0A521EA55_9SPHI|nr:DUF4142 domain-containing protein [Pedobacter westerhofensis]SMO80803.1 putative membrane protein [Pedobacter westerhofensis]
MKKLLFMIALSGAFAAHAQIPQPDPDTTTRHFLIVASIKNLQEVSAGEQAVKKGKNPEVKSFGKMMVTDHGAAEKQLLQLAKSRHIDLPPAATGGIKPDPLLDHAPDFDSAFVHAMSAGHGNTVQVFENYGTTGKDPSVKAWAQQMLPKLKMHLEHVKALEKQMK